MHRRATHLLGGAVILLALSACGQPAPTTDATGTASPSAAASPAAGMDHGSMGHGSATATADAPFDALFIDSMIVHHEGAIAMAQQALEEAERSEVQQLAQEIVDAQQQEIAQMREWRQEWYPDLPETGGMGMEMGEMMISDDASQSFDQRFIAAMIGHHQGAIEMARAAQQQAEHPEIRELANDVVDVQQREIDQMQQWLQEWYGVTQ